MSKRKNISQELDDDVLGYEDDGVGDNDDDHQEKIHGIITEKTMLMMIDKILKI